MLRLQVLLFICILILGSLPEGWAQPTDKQIGEWVSLLSKKADPRAARLESVLKDLRVYEVPVQCKTTEKLVEAAQESNNTRCQIRVRLIRHILDQNGDICPKNESLTDNLGAALQAAYELEDEALQYEIHLRQGQLYNGMQQYGQAAMHFLLFFEILGRHPRSEFRLPAGAFYDMSFSLYHTHEYRECITAGMSGLGLSSVPAYIPDDTLNTYQQMQAWNTVGLAYQKLQLPDSAFIAFDHAALVAEQLHDLFWIGIIKGNKGDVYYDLEKFDSAYVLLQYDVDQSIQYQQWDNAANSLQWLARIDLRKGHTRDALEKLRQAHAYLERQPAPAYLANVCYGFSQAFTNLGQADSANAYIVRYLHLHDSLQAEIADSRAEILQMRIHNLNQIQTIKSLNREKQLIMVSRNAAIIIVLLAGVLGYLWFHRVRLKMLLRQKEAMDAKRRAEAESQKATEQLAEYRQHLLEKNEIIEKWQTASETKSFSEDQLKRLSDLTHHLILNEDDWLRFKALFDSVYPGFFHTLRNRVPDITQAEQRMAALSKLKLTTKEAANLLGVSPNTVYTTRRRLRMRLGLEQDGDLDTYLREGGTEP